VINKTIEVYGEIDILLNNAGISMRALFSDLDLSVFDKVMKVNFYGTLYCHINILKYILQNIMVKAF
jgi:NAD(P)-dependent dehydrogenase (short-subunit alcohol dehydrogenase family)